MDGEITNQKSINEVTSQVYQPALQHNGKSQTELPGVEEGGPELSILPGQAGSYSKEASKRKKVRISLTFGGSHNIIIKYDHMNGRSFQITQASGYKQSLLQRQGI